MATKTIKVCDRCNAETNNFKGFDWRGTNLELCVGCWTRAKELLDSLTDFFVDVKIAAKEDPLQKLKDAMEKHPKSEPYWPQTTPWPQMPIPRCPRTPHYPYRPLPEYDMFRGNGRG